MSQEPASLFVRLAPVLNVSDLTAERAFYEKLGLPVIYEGPEYPDFIAFGTGNAHFGIQRAEAANDPPAVLTWQIRVTDIERAMERCQSADISFELEHNEPAPGWTYRRLLIRTPPGPRRRQRIGVSGWTVHGCIARPAGIVRERPARDAGSARSELDSRDPSR